MPTKGATPPNYMKNTFVNSHKTLKFMKVFSLESFPLYGSLISTKLSKCKQWRGEGAGRGREGERAGNVDTGLLHCQHCQPFHHNLA